jgi:F-type H+-transporting ATPase subunit b
MIELIQQAGIFLFAADVPVTQPEPSLVDQVGQFIVGAIPTALLFIVLVLCYEFLVQKPLSRILNERRARTEGAIEDAHRAIAQAEARASEYANKLRQARAEIFKMREQRIKKWSAERDATLDEARKAAGARVGLAKADLEAETESARLAIQGSAAELALQVVRAVLPVPAGGSR